MPKMKIEFRACVYLQKLKEKYNFGGDFYA